jgi:hypothetical protein
MQINKLVEQILSEPALELLNTLVAHALVNPSSDRSALSTLPVEPDSWNSTMLLLREIFEAEILVSGDVEWLGFRILQSYGAKDGRLAYSFTSTFAQTFSTI